VCRFDVYQLCGGKNESSYKINRAFNSIEHDKLHSLATHNLLFDGHIREKGLLLDGSVTSISTTLAKTGRKLELTTITLWK